jgi:signal peptidase I
MPAKPPLTHIRHRRVHIPSPPLYIVLLVLIPLLFFLFVVRTYTVPTGSMTPTLPVGGWVVVDQLAYQFTSPHRGDIIIFTPPAAAHYTCARTAPSEPFVKRIVGLPGDLISLRAGHVYIDNRRLAEPYLPSTTRTTPQYTDPVTGLTHSYRVPSGRYFVMGDNRSISCDSRYWGTIPTSAIEGRVDFHS